MAYEYSRCLGLLYGVSDVGTATFSAAIDSPFAWDASGDAWYCRFTAPVGQSAATLTLYVYVGTAVTGDPTFQIEVRDAATATTPEQPEAGGSDLASSPSTLTLGAGDASTWVALTCTVSLTAGNSYWVILKNTHATPASNHAAFAIRGALDSFAGTGGFSNVLQYVASAGYTTDGFAAPTNTNQTNGPGAFVLKFGDGTLLGFPFVSSSNHANNTNDRGIRVQFAEDVVVSGIWGPAVQAAISGFAIYTTAGAQVVLANSTYYDEQKSVGCRFAPVTLSGGTAYDVVTKIASNSTIGTAYTMGEAEADVPADVLACRLPGMATVDGATPGSYTVDTSRTMFTGLIIDNNPAIAGGGGVNLAGGMSGGIRN